MGRARIDGIYPEIDFGGFTRANMSILFLSRCQALARRARAVLDVGCGRGQGHEDRCEYRRDLRDLRASGRKVIGIDVDAAGASNPFLDEFRQIGPDFRWPVEDASIDFAVSDYVLEHVPNPSSYLGELRRVLRPGGVFLTRTPNRWSYIAIASRIIPNRMHAQVLAKVQDNRKSEDVFPTVYRMNTPRVLRRQIEQAGLQGVVYTVEGEPTYMQFSHAAFWVMDKVHAVLPPLFRSTLIAMARKPA